MAIIKTLKDFLTKATLYPITKTQAVYDDTVGRLDSYLQNTLGAEPIDDVGGEEAEIRDADTLGGRYTAEDLDAMPKSTAIEDYANIEPPITDADKLGGKYTAKDIDKMKQDIIDIYVGDDGKLHKVQGGADSVLPFSGLKGVAVLSAVKYTDGKIYPTCFFRAMSNDFADDIASLEGEWCYENPLTITIKKKITTKIIIRTLTRGHGASMTVTHNDIIVSSEDTLLLNENDIISLQVSISDAESYGTILVLFM